MSYAGLDAAASTTSPHLGGSVKIGDPFTYCPSAWDYVISRFSVESVIDVGSGSGNASFYFFKKGLKVVAIEGLRESVEASLYPAIQCDMTQGPIYTKVDFAHCQEVAEHIEEQYLDHFLKTLLNAKIIMMTHALPGQGGYHHVNLQSSDYWIDNMVRRGCGFLEEDTQRVRRLAEKDGARYLQASGLLFVNRARI